jgi:hypothetical protein
LGYDGYEGTFTRPFQTITHAMAMVTSGKTVRVLPGTYIAPPETFPITIPLGVEIIGDVPNKGNGSTPTLVSGSGVVVAGETATFTSAGTSASAATGALRGFKLSGPNTVMSFLVRTSESILIIEGNTFNDAYGGVRALGSWFCPTVTGGTFNTVSQGVFSSCGGTTMISANTFNTPAIPMYCDGGKPIVDGNMIDGVGIAGMQILGSGSPLLTGNTFMHSGGYVDGAITFSDASTPKLRGNHFDAIYTAMALRIMGQVVPDLGTTADSGGNTFGDAYINVDSAWTAGKTISAFGNSWNSGPTCGANIKFNAAPGGSVVWDNGGHCP